jgi:hypothetical protein
MSLHTDTGSDHECVLVVMICNIFWSWRIDNRVFEGDPIPPTDLLVVLQFHFLEGRDVHLIYFFKDRRRWAV